MPRKGTSNRTAATILGALALFVAIAIAVPLAAAGAYDCRPKRGRDSCVFDGPNAAPAIGGTPPGAVNVGEAYSFQPTATDPDSRMLFFSIQNRPRWASFNFFTGRLTGKPTASAVGEYVDIAIRVSDGKATAELPPFSIVVSQGEDNGAPSIAGTPPTAAREGQVYEFKPTATDPDGDALIFSIANRPSWASFDAATGTLKGTPDNGTAGTYYAGIAIRVSDGKTSASLPEFSIAVEQASLGSVTLSWTAPTRRTDGSPLTGLAGYRVYYGTAAGSYPNRVEIPNPGVTTCVIDNLPPGIYYFVATAYDASGRESDFSGTVSKTIG